METMRTCYPPIRFQMWDQANKRMFEWENNDHRVLIAAVIVKDMENIRLLPFSGVNDSNGKDIYLDDVARVTIRNEFGSLEILLVQMSYFPDYAAYGFNFHNRFLHPDQIVKVEKMGNLNASPELMDIGKKVNFNAV